MSAPIESRVAARVEYLLWCQWIPEGELLSAHASQEGAERAMSSAIGTRKYGQDVVAQQLDIQPIEVSD